MTDTKYCTCGECGKSTPEQRRGLCRSCYHRMLRTPEYRAARGLDLSTAERFMAQVEVDSSGCWLWTGLTGENGYGQFAGKWAHRFAYERFVGPIPRGMQIDHVRAKGCTSRRCVNWVDHLEVVTAQENVLRSPNTVAFQWASRTHCNSGHAFDDANTAVRRRRDNPLRTYRVCRRCHNARQNVRRAARKAGAR